MNIGVKPDEQTRLYDEIGKLTGWEREQTNKEWIQSATTEQLAGFLDRIIDFCEMCEKHCDNDTGMQCNGDFIGHWVEWLMKPHGKDS